VQGPIGGFDARSVAENAPTPGLGDEPPSQAYRDG
jgi:hypothetical protein